MIEPAERFCPPRRTLDWNQVVLASKQGIDNDCAQLPPVLDETDTISWHKVGGAHTALLNFIKASVCLGDRGEWIAFRRNGIWRCD